MMVRWIWKGAPIKGTVTGDVHRVKRLHSQPMVSGVHVIRYLDGEPVMWGKGLADSMGATPLMPM